MPILRACMFVCTALLCGGVLGATTATVVDLPTRGVTVRILHLRPDAPIGNALVLPGGTGSWAS